MRLYSNKANGLTLAVSSVVAVAAADSASFLKRQTRLAAVAILRRLPIGDSAVGLLLEQWRQLRF
jgi:hypothetical protein